MTKLETQLACPEPPARLAEDLPPPVFAPAESWVAWSDALISWGAEEALRRHDLVRWYAANCRGGKGDA